MEAGTKPSSEQIEQEIAELLDREIFEPPQEFADQALLNDESVYEEAAEDPPAWWAAQSKELLNWHEDFDESLDESETLESVEGC